MTSQTEQSRAADPSGVNDLVRSELPRLYNLCLHLTLDTAEAEALVEATFARAARSAATQKDARVSTWLDRLAIAEWKERSTGVERRGRTKAVSLAAGLARPEAPSLPAPWDALPTNHKLLLAALRDLEDDDRAVIVLRDIAGKPYAEICEALKISPRTLKARLSESRENLRSMFRRLGGVT